MTSNTQPRISLDANATTRPFPEVVDLVARHLRETPGNPGSRHAEGRQARRVLETAREQIAELLGADPQEVIFTSGGTEANNLAIQGRTLGATGSIAVSAGEHPATAETILSLQQRGWRILSLPLDREGILLNGGCLSDSQAERANPRGQATGNYFSPRPGTPGRGVGGEGQIAASNTPHPQPLSPEYRGEGSFQRHLDVPTDLKLVSVLWANNETGVIQDLSPLAQWCQQRRVPLFVDAVQAVSKIPVHFHDLGVTMLSCGAHKFHGPRGVGALLVRDGVKLLPLTYGGHQEAGRRPGTESVALVAGMALALEICCRDLDRRRARLCALRDRLQAGLQAQCAPAVVNGSQERRLPNTLNLSFPGIDGEALLVGLDLAGVSVSLGSACASGSTEPSPVLLAMGCPPEIYRSALRLSVSTDNTDDDIDEAIRRITEVVRSLRGDSVAR